MKSNIRNVGYLALVIFTMLILPSAFAADANVNVTGDITNNPPVISAVYVDKNTTSSCTSDDFDSTTVALSTYTPGTDYLCIRVVVTDPNGDDEIDVNSFDTDDDSNIMIFKDGGTESLATSNKWDYHFINQFKRCDTTADTNAVPAGAGEICAELAPDSTGLNSDTGFGVKDLNGLYHITAWMQDLNGNSAPDVNRDANITAVDTTVGVSLDETACTFSGTSDNNVALDCPSVGNDENIIATHEGNIPATLKLRASSALTGPLSDTIPTSAFYYHTSDLGELDMNLADATSALDSDYDVNTDWTRGTPDTAATQSSWIYLELPSNLASGAYTGGKLTYTVVAN